MPVPARVRRRRRFQQPGAALVLEPVALALDADDGRMVQQPVEHRRGQHRVAGEGLIPRPEGQVRGQDHRALLVALGDDLEEQVGLFAPQRQVADLVDDQELVDADGAVHRLLPTALALRRLERHDQIGGGGEAHLVAVLGGQVAERDRQMRLADAARGRGRRRSRRAR